MCTGKGIVDIDLPERRQLPCELEVIFFLSLVEPHVLQNRDLARGHARETLARGLSDAIRYEADRDLAQHVSESSSDGREREFGLTTARTAEMREQDHARFARHEITDRRQNPLEASRVGYLLAPHRHVQVCADQHGLSTHVDLCDRSDSRCGHCRRVHHGIAGHAAKAIDCQSDIIEINLA